jgi:hypothetical protein
MQAERPDRKEQSMSVLLTFRAKGDPAELERRAAANPDGMKEISDRAKEFGLIAHRFYGSDDGQIMVVDEWPDAESFHRFFEAMGPTIQPMMAEVGVTTEPEIIFWRKLETHDDVGWNA